MPPPPLVLAALLYGPLQVVASRPSRLGAHPHNALAVRPDGRQTSEAADEAREPPSLRLLHKYSGEASSWGSTSLDMQEAGLRLLNGAARWVWRRLSWPPELPPYGLDGFDRYVAAFVELWLELRVTPACDAKALALRDIVSNATESLRGLSSDGVARLPKVTTDDGLAELWARVGYPPGANGTGHFGTSDATERLAPDCAELNGGLRQRFCAPCGGRPGWRFWFEEWLPALLDTLSCGWENDAAAWTTWRWVTDGPPLSGNMVEPRGWFWDVHAMQTSQELRDLAHEGDERLVFKAWRLTHRYLTNPEMFAFEPTSKYHQKELARFVPFIGEALDRRLLSCEYNPDTSDWEELPPHSNAQCFQVVNFQATERQQFYGPVVWRFFHTSAEAAATSGAPHILEKFKSFLTLFAKFHPCPHCREHLNTKVQHSALDAYDPGRELAEGEDPWLEPEEIRAYPLEWLTLVGQTQGHVLGSDVEATDPPELGGWKALVACNSSETEVNLTTKLRSTTKPQDLRVFMLKMHNAVDSSIESKREDRVLPWPASYWPVSERYRSTEPWGESGVPTADSWAAFRVGLTSACGLDQGGPASSSCLGESSGISDGASLFPLVLLPREQANTTEADRTHLETLRRQGFRWRALWLAYLRLVWLLKSASDPCGQELNRALHRGDEGASFRALVRGAIRVESPQQQGSGGPQPDTGGGDPLGSACQVGAGTAPGRGIATVATEAQQFAMAHWLADWSLWSRLLRSLEHMVECVVRYVVDSGLLQAKYGLRRPPPLL